MTIQDRIRRLRVIKMEIQELAEEALELLGDEKQSLHNWYAAMEAALDSDSDYSWSLQDALDELAEQQPVQHQSTP